MAESRLDGPFSKSFSAAFSRLPAKTTTEVVPSPASMSWDADRSTNILAAGCMTAICFRMVAPSLVTRTSVGPLWIILSMPLGPREVLTASATAIVAIAHEISGKDAQEKEVS